MNYIKPDPHILNIVLKLKYIKKKFETSVSFKS